MVRRDIETLVLWHESDFLISICHVLPLLFFSADYKAHVFWWIFKKLFGFFLVSKKCDIILHYEFINVSRLKQFSTLLYK